MRRRLEADAASQLASRADDLRRAHEEAGRLEVRLRSAIEAAERSGSQLSIKEEQMNLRLAQKTGELQLLQKRVRDEAKTRVDTERHRADALDRQLKQALIEKERMEKRAKDSEKDFETFRHNMRSVPESVLREEVARLKAQLGESRAEIERERRVRAEAELEKEHFRGQMHRLALALKREREKSSTLARQELEQLRLEFLAREERYVLDGDRDELRTIRHELANLRAGQLSQGQGQGQDQGQQQPPYVPSNAHGKENNANMGMGTGMGLGMGNNNERNTQQQQQLQGMRSQLSVLLSSGMYEDSDAAVTDLKSSIGILENRAASAAIHIGGSGRE